MKVDKATVRKLQEAMSEHAKAAGALMGWDGLTATGTTASFDPTAGEIKVTLKWAVKTDEQQRAGFASLCGLFGVKPEAYGTVLTMYGGQQHRLVGFNLARRRYPVVTESLETGKTIMWEERVLNRVPAELREARESAAVVEFVPRPRPKE